MDFKARRAARLEAEAHPLLLRAAALPADAPTLWLHDQEEWRELVAAIDAALAAGVPRKGLRRAADAAMTYATRYGRERPPDPAHDPADLARLARDLGDVGAWLATRGPSLVLWAYVDRGAPVTRLWRAGASSAEDAGPAAEALARLGRRILLTRGYRLQIRGRPLLPSLVMGEDAREMSNHRRLAGLARVRAALGRQEGA